MNMTDKEAKRIGILCDHCEAYVGQAIGCSRLCQHCQELLEALAENDHDE